MYSSKETYQSKVFQDFKEINSREYQSIVRFFEQYQADIKLLTFGEYFELLIAYMNALFEVGAYQNYIDSSDYAIEATINFNIKSFNGKNIYRHLLFRKAASYYHMMEYSKATHILKELIKLDPTDKLPVKLLRKTYNANKPNYFKKIRAASILLFLLTAGIISLELLFVRESLFQEYTQIVEWSRHATFGIGFGILLIGEFAIRVKSKLSVDKLVNKIKTKKAKQSI